MHLAFLKCFSCAIDDDGEKARTHSVLLSDDAAMLEQPCVPRSKRSSMLLLMRRSTTITNSWLSTCSKFFSSIVTVRVAPQPAMPFAVHLDLLRRESPWFADMLQKNQQDLDLQKVPPRTLRLFSAWLYAGELVHPDVALCDTMPPNPMTDKTRDNEPVWPDIDLASLYIFGEHYRVRKLRNDVITALYHDHDRTKRITSEAAIRLCYTFCEPNSALGRFIVQERALYGMRDSKSIPAYFKTLPASFLANVIRASASLNGYRTRGHAIQELPCLCHWHDHDGNDEEKTACRQRLACAQIPTIPSLADAHQDKCHTRRRTAQQSKPRTDNSCSGMINASTAMLSDAWKHNSSALGVWKLDSELFHPIWISPAYPTLPPMCESTEFAPVTPASLQQQIRRHTQP